jgi:two-component system, chemotaxis family, sensor kinase Cph1
MAVQAREHLQHIEDAVRRMGLLIEALLNMTVLRRRSSRLSHNELNPIVDEVISVLQPDCNGRDVGWRIAKLPALDCDPILMAQVFQNLLGNALKYSRGRARAVIEVDSIQQLGKTAGHLRARQRRGFQHEICRETVRRVPALPHGIRV